MMGSLMFSSRVSVGTVRMLLANIWLSLLSVSDFAFLMLSISIWKSFCMMLNSSVNWLRSTRSFISLSSFSPPKIA